MKNKIIAKDKKHLKFLLSEEWNINGNNCDLNHIDVSNVTDLSYVFNCLDFHGDISKWDVSNVESMAGLFFACEFNGDISKWNVGNVITMQDMFIHSKFNGNLEEWKPLNLISCENVFNEKEENIPYWANYKDNEIRNKAINSYHLQKNLDKQLSTANIIKTIKKKL